MNYNLDEIKEKAKYCLSCKNKPCKLGCPLQNNIPDFINAIKQDRYEAATEILMQTTIFEPICGRICPHKSQCEGSCVRGIKGKSVSIGQLEAFVGDYMINNYKNKTSTKDLINCSTRIAIVGSGPAGIACAYYLSKKGFKITIYEKHSKLGGLLRYGIPEFRLEKQLLDKWIENCILNDNIEVVTNISLGKDIQIDELKQNHELIVLAFGANVSNKMNIEGEDLNFVLGGNELLEYKNSMPDFRNKSVAVIGGGNVAMDSARTIKKLGATKVKIIYRRSESEMPAEEKEIQVAKNEGIEFLLQTNVIKITYKSEIECVKTKLIQKEGEDRKVPVNIEGTNYLMNTDYVVLALGSNVDKRTTNTLNLEINKWGYIKVDEDYRTSDNQIFAVRRFNRY